jgi:hypothetical protein
VSGVMLPPRKPSMKQANGGSGRQPVHQASVFRLTGEPRC